ncbi:hypothetical protein ACHAWT_011133 [Skeletonema menzelii]
MSNRYVRGAPPPTNGGRQWTASSSSSYRHSSRGRRGRGHGRGRTFGRGGRFPNHSFERNETPTASNKWVRPASIEKQVGNDKEAAVTLESKSDGEATLPSEHIIRDGSKNKELSDSDAEERTTTSSSYVQMPEQNLERRGRNKLVMKKKATEPGISSDSKVEHIHIGENVVPTKFNEEIKTSSDVLKPEQNLERRSRHKLVMKKNESGMSSPNDHVTVRSQTKTEEKGTLDVQKPEQNLERKGRHKLVLKKDETEPISKSNQSRSTEDNTIYSWKRHPTELAALPKNDEDETKSKQDEVQSGPPVKRKRPETFLGPRRILLSSAATEERQDTVLGTNEQPQKTMTDYQYQDTSARGGRGRGRGKGKAMGLVRVKPKNPTETPICPTFSRGLPCNNVKCRLRHDVSTEASRPMCVFFQRNGMCSKGDDCPFKHVKISWDAEICPTFERLGYCEDQGCVLRHVASKRSNTKR